MFLLFSGERFEGLTRPDIGLLLDRILVKGNRLLLSLQSEVNNFLDRLKAHACLPLVAVLGVTLQEIDFYVKKIYVKVAFCQGSGRPACRGSLRPACRPADNRPMYPVQCP